MLHHIGYTFLDKGIRWHLLPVGFIFLQGLTLHLNGSANTFKYLRVHNNTK